MKHILIILVTLLSGNSFLEMENDSFDKLWAEVEAFEKQRLPKSAYDIVNAIYKKAKAENADDQLVKAAIYKLKLSAQFEDRDPAEFILELEGELSSVKSIAVKKIVMSMLGELYHQYGMRNMGRFQNRTEVVEEKESNKLSLMSLAELQTTSYNYYLQSIDEIPDSDISEFKLLTNAATSLRFLIEAKSLKQLLYLRAIEHFGNSQSLLALPINNYSLNNKSFFKVDKTFVGLDIPQKNAQDFKLEALRLYQDIAKSALFSTDQKLRFQLQRLEYIRSNSDINNKEKLYVETLENITEEDKGNPSRQLAYIKLTEYYLQLGERNNNQDNDSEIDAYKEVYRWIQKGKDEFQKGAYNDIVESQRMRLNRQSLKVQTEQVVVANADFLASVQYRNSPTVYLRLIKLNAEQLDQYNLKRRQDDKLSYLLNQSKLKEWSINLPKADDFNNHSIEIPIDGLDFGTYFLLSSTKSNFEYDEYDLDLINQFQVSNLTYVHQNRDGSLEGYVLDRNDGTPVAGANVDVFVSQYMPNERRSDWQKVESLKSDSEGFFRYKGGLNNFSVKVSKGNDVLDLRVSHYNYNNSNNREMSSVTLFTDRAIYRPGQLVYFKGIVLNQSNKIRVPSIVSNEKIVIKFKDANWQDISEQSFTTNEYGTFNGKFVAPSSGLLGRYSLVVELRNGNGQKQIQIEEYKRPKFYVEFDKLKDSHVLGDDITAKGSVIAFSGVRMSGAKVKYYVLRKQNYYPYYYSWRRPGNQRTEEVIERGEVMTNKEGNFEIGFSTESSFKKNQSYLYELKVDVTDLTGMSTSGSKQIVVSQVPFNFKSNFPKNTFDTDLDKYNLEVNNNEGEAIASKVKMTVSLLESPEMAKKTRYWESPDIMFLSLDDFNKRLPNESYGDNQSPVRWKVQKVIKSEEFEFSKPFGVSLKGLDKGAYKVDFVVSDTNGNSKEYAEYLNVTSKKGCAIPTDYIWNSNLKSKYQPGDKLNLNFNFPYKKFNVYYRINQGDRVLESGTFTRKNKSIQYIINEMDRGNLDIELMYVKHNRIHSKHLTVNIPWDNKNLNLSIDKFRNKLEPGSDENWTVKVMDNDGANVTAEILAGMYDSSLDQFIDHSWMSSFFPTYYSQMRFNGVGFSANNAITLRRNSNQGYQTYLSGYSPYLNWFNFSLPYRGYGNSGGRIMKRGGAPMASQAMPMEDGDSAMMESSAVDGDQNESDAIGTKDSNENIDNPASEKPINVRENLNETVFFYPEMKTSKNGEASLSFKMNEALTKWKLLIFAHTTDMKYTFDEFILETSKDLIIEPNLPRFLRQGDNISLNAKVTNLSDSILEVSSKINLMAHTTRIDVTDSMLGDISEVQTLTLAKGESKIVSWSVKVPTDFIDLLDIKMTVNNNLVSDGELNQLPVLSNRMLVTETMVMHVGALENEVFKFDAMRKMDSSATLENFKYSLEFYTNPSWLVLKSLPSMMDSESIITTNIFDTYYATSLGFDLVNKDQRVKDMIRVWNAENEQGSLATNQDLKLSELKETPWVRESIAEDENIRMLSSFLDENNINQTLNELSQKIKDRQLSNGGFTWTPGGRDNWYITQYILEGLARLKSLDVDISSFNKSMLDEAVFYTDQEMLTMYKKRGDNNKNLDPIVVQYMYVRPQYINVPVSRQLRAVIDHYQDLIIENWTKRGTYEQGLMAYGLYLDDKTSDATSILNSLKERLVRDEKLGYYWNDQAGYYWYNADVEKQAFMIGLFKLMEDDQSIIDGLKLWLLKNKQTNSWKTSKATSSAVYAFMKDSDNWIKNTGDVKVSLPLLNEVVNTDTEKSNGLIIRKEWQGKEITPSLNEVKIENPNNHVTWGASYWQYFEDLDNIERFTGTPLKLEKKLFKVVQSDKGDQLLALDNNTKLEVGDKLRVKIYLNIDRPMEFVQMKDLRGSGLEPINVLSKYKWQDGLGYYESTKDVATYFYFDYLPKGNFVFEYETFVVHEGTYSNGNCSIQSMYAPEFGSHSAGEVLIVE